MLSIFTSPSTARDIAAWSRTSTAIVAPPTRLINAAAWLTFEPPAGSCMPNVSFEPSPASKSVRRSKPN